MTKEELGGEKMNDLKKYSTAQLVEELRGRTDEVMLCSEPIKKPLCCIIRDESLHTQIPAGYAIIAVKPARESE